ncbi:MAG: hypothetical protein AB1Z55_02085 [Acidimicrobiia bacterium]
MGRFLRTVVLFALIVGVGFAAFLLYDRTFSTGSAGAGCEPVAAVSGDVSGDAVAVSVARSAAVFPCASAAVVADADDPIALAFGARLAAQEALPLLASGPEVPAAIRAELDRLGADDLLVVGSSDLAGALAGDVAESWNLRLADEVADLEARILAGVSDPDRPPIGIPADPAAAFAAVRTAIAEDRPVVLGPGTAGAQKPPLQPEAPMWVATTDRADVAMASLAAADATGALVALVDGDDPRRSLDVREAATDAGIVSLIGDFGDDQGWQTRTLLTAAELPGGGVLVFEPGRRYVAAYGNPNTPRLGVLGEQGPEGWAETAERLAEMVQGYDADGLPVVPTFEIIATVAAGDPGPDGDYSAEMRIETLQGWVDYARENDIYVVLDLQPGRTDFLSQARRYESLLLEPHVGLALDPEWRLAPDEVHLEQVGSVGIAEVNATANWLADLVRENGLPQKLFIVHQFLFSMIEGREDIVIPPELAGLIQMDGQGPLESKYDTWAALTEGTEGAPYRWGWKNFYDEDSPTATPEQVLAVEPTVWFVSYQ